PLLRVHARRLARGDAKKERVEAVDVVHEAAPARVHLAGVCRIGAVEEVPVPAVGRHFLDGMNAVPQQLPEGLWVRGPWEATAQADDGNGFFGAALGRYGR